MDPDDLQETLPLGEPGEAETPGPGGDYEAGEPSEAAFEPAEPTVSRAEYDRAMAELEQERARSRDAQAWIEQAGRRMDLDSSVRRQLEQMYRDHTAHQAHLAQAREQLQPPAPASVEEWLVEPGQIADYVRQHGEWVQRTMLAQLHPFLQRLALYDSVLPSVLGREAEASMAQAKQMLAEEGIHDFDEIRPEIEQAFAQNPAGSRLVLDPATVASVYHFLARQRGVKPVREVSKPVPSAGTSRPGSRARPSAAALSPALRAMAERLQIQPSRLAERLAQRRATA